MPKHTSNTAEHSSASDACTDKSGGSYAHKPPTEHDKEIVPTKDNESDTVSESFDGAAPSEKPRLATARHAKVRQPLSPHMRKSRRMRKILIVVLILLVVVIGALIFFSFQWFSESKVVASQQVQTQQNTQKSDALQQGKTDSKDASTTTAKKASVPALTSLLGMTQDQAVAALKQGATVSGSQDTNDPSSPIKKNVTVALTDDPADPRSGTPTVYLGLNEGGSVVQAGYSAATASLGYGPVSFSDAINNEHIVEKTLQEAGATVPEGSVKLPQDKSAYSQYASDGTTLVKETCPFSGTAEFNGASHQWSAVLLYDYTTSNVSGNLSDTIRMIYIYVNA